MNQKRIPPADGQESVWDYPRPPRWEQSNRLMRVFFDGALVVETPNAIRVLETSHPPVYYAPPNDIEAGLITCSTRGAFCEWKGDAQYFDVTSGDDRTKNAAWAYPDPSPDFAILKDYVAFYPALMESCWLDDERVSPQPGVFYGGWITADIVGPFKGEPGSEFW
jgi:uncharacterized protein (DUF427 family)